MTALVDPSLASVGLANGLQLHFLEPWPFPLELSGAEWAGLRGAGAVTDTPRR